MLIRRLLASDAAAFQALRLAALKESPSAFGSSYEDEHATPIETIAANLVQRNLFGAFEGDALAGMIGVGRDSAAKARHKATIRAMYVAPDQRGKGLGRQLLEHALGFAKAMDGVCQVTLDVTADNAAAMALYASHGFIIYGKEPRAMLVDGQFHDTVLMVHMLTGR
jgi:ribosomal protein S18 acetylase RimI-like enzyme